MFYGVQLSVCVSEYVILLKFYLKGLSHSEILPGIEVKNLRLIVQILFKLYSKNRKRKSGQTFYVSDLLNDLIGRSIKIHVGISPFT